MLQPHVGNDTDDLMEGRNCLFDPESDWSQIEAEVNGRNDFIGHSHAMSDELKHVEIV